MSREALNDFLHAVEHCGSLRRNVNQCSSEKALARLALNYGFLIPEEDLKMEDVNSSLQHWFNNSQIKSIFRS